MSTVIVVPTTLVTPCFEATTKRYLSSWLNRDKDNVKFVKAKDDNKIQIENIAKMVDDNSKTKTLVTSHVQYSTGFRQDLKELGRLTKQK